MAGDSDRQLAVDRLRALVQEETDLYVGNPVDEKLLLRYLYYADFNIDKAFEKIKHGYKLKAQNTDFYALRRDPNVHDVILKKGIHLLLDNRDQLGRRVYLLKLGRLVYGAHEPHEIFQVDDLWFNLALDEEETQKNGIAIVFDMQDMPWRFLRFFTPHIIRVSTTKAENIPLRHIQWHVINAGLFLNAVLQLVFPFLSQATKDSVYFHKTNESLHAHICPSALPEEYGGKIPAIDPAALVRDYMDPKNDRLAELLSYGYKANKSVKK